MQGGRSVIPLARPGYFHCQACRNQFTALHATPLEGTHLPLRTWFGALYLTSTSSRGISAMVLSRQLDIGYKTAWFLAHRIRTLMTQDQWAVSRASSRPTKCLLAASSGRRTRPANATTLTTSYDQPQRPRRHAQGDGGSGG
jgi:hypothetical protein